MKSESVARLQHDTEWFKGSIKKMEEKWKMQDTCKHDFGEPTDTLMGYGRQCHYIEKVKNPAKR